MEANKTNLSSSSSSSVHALSVDIILSKIVEYVGANSSKQHLLSYRLVNHAWNCKIVSYLRSCSDNKASHQHQRCSSSIALDSCNIQEYLELIRRNSEIGLNRLSISVTELISQEQLVLLLDCADELVQLLGQSCVKSIKLCPAEPLHASPYSTTNWISLLKFIQLVSPGLEELAIIQGSLFPNSLEFVDPFFPSLHTLQFGPFLANPTLLLQLINGAPGLRKLIIRKPPTSRTTSASTVAAGAEDYVGHQGTRLVELYTGIHHHQHQHQHKAFHSQLAELVIPLDEPATFAALVRLHFPGLRKLTMSLYMEVSEVPAAAVAGNEAPRGAATHLATFLSSPACCPQLESLTFEFLYSSAFSKDFPAGLPPLPKLKHLGYHFVCSNSGGAAAAAAYSAASGESPHFLKLDNHSLTPSKFQALSSVSTDLGVCLYMAANRHNRPYGRWYNNPFYCAHLQFPTVHTLHLTLRVINYAAPSEGSITVVENLNQLHLLYPNLRKVGVTNQMPPSTRYYKGQSEGEIFKALLQELSGLEELEITNYHHDWISEILLLQQQQQQESQAPSPTVVQVNIGSLRSLKLSSIDKSWRIPYPAISFELWLRFMSNLRVLTVKEEFLNSSRDKIKNCPQQLLSRIQIEVI